MKLAGRNYLVTVVASLIILAIVIAGIIFNLVTGKTDINDIVLESSGGVPALTPGGNNGPSGPPNLPDPTFAPPGN